MCVKARFCFIFIAVFKNIVIRVLHHFQTNTCFDQWRAKSAKVISAIFMGLLFVSASHAGWEVTWIDKFEGNSVNWNKWTAQTQANYNNEVQCYTDDDSSDKRNYEVSDGTLKIISRKENNSCVGLNGINKTWTSGRLNSKDKGEFLYGRVEARIRFLELRGGTWPAFWMLENRIAEQPIKGDGDSINWPNPGAGEIDVWEWYGNNGDRYITNFFNTGGCGAEVRKTYTGGAPDVMTYQTYAMEWTADEVAFYMNDELVATQDMTNCSQYEEPMFVLLNVAMGGNLGGNIDPTLETATMEVDYVAHCAKTDTNSFNRCNESTPTAADDDNDGVVNSQDECPDTPAGTNVAQNGCEIVDAPKLAAEEPSTPESQVISLFSDAYTNISEIDYNPNWGQATQVSMEVIDGNNVLKYSNLNYQGTDFENNPQDVRGMDFVNLDYWTNDSSVLQFFIISPGPRETAFNIDVKREQWETVKIPLSAFSNVDLSDIFQLKIEGNGSVYLDNIYFSSDEAVSIDTDGDGVEDGTDLCPETPQGTQVDETGCPVEQNVAPSVSVVATQSSENISRIAIDAGSVTVQAQVSDDNEGDEHTYVWSVTGLDSYSGEGAQITFNPSAVSASQVVISVEVTDSGALNADASITLAVEQPAAAPEPSDASSSGGANSVFVIFILFIMASLRSILSSMLHRRETQ